MAEAALDQVPKASSMYMFSARCTRPTCRNMLVNRRQGWSVRLYAARLPPQPSMEAVLGASQLTPVNTCARYTITLMAKRA